MLEWEYDVHSIRLCHSVIFNGVSLNLQQVHINDTGLQFHIFDSMFYWL